MNVRRPFIRSSGWKLRQKSLRDFLGQANRRALALASARSLAGSSLRDSKPPLAPRPCRTRIQFHGLHESIQNKSPTGLRRRGFYPKQWLEIKAEIAARFPWSGESERPCACQRKVARGLVAARLETPARPSSVPDEDSIPRSAREVFKTKAPPACAGGAFIRSSGWKLRQKSLRDFLGQANRRALALASARSLAGSSLRDSKPPLAPRPCRTRIQFHGLHERYSK
jgi:hypothetical protein